DDLTVRNGDEATEARHQRVLTLERDVARRARDADLSSTAPVLHPVAHRPRRTPHNRTHVRDRHLALDRRTDLTRQRVVLVHLTVVPDVVAVLVHDVGASEHVRQLLVPLVTQVRHERLIQPDLRPLHERILPRREERRQVPQVVLEIRPARRVVQGVRHVPLRSSTSSLHRLVDLIQRQEVLSISLRRLTATARTLNPPSLPDVVQFALKLHHEQRVTRPHSLRNRRELLEVPVTKVLRRLTSHLEPLRALTVLNHILERALRDSQRRTRNLLRVRDAHIPGQFPSRVHRLEVLPLIHQGLPLLHQPVQVAALLLVPGAGLPPGRDPGIHVLDLTTKVIALVLGDPPALLALGQRLARGRGRSLSPHLVGRVRRQVTPTSHRQGPTRGQHPINPARRLTHRARQRHAVLRPILSPRDPLRVTRSPLEQVVLRLG